ncbi:ROK family transcriptional regulator [Falsibacillus albus]|uniref:ROK family transcriptional regulator n=1 Tax=Falsibacillus albus TaxID=2478915 RepID=A0A3L7K1X2_9BACI|nr:ROK family transcriptional regulator [Falsibacillus albus]RLQ96605.1 ROK family transcriptional regulator [Falsibacillus albus]
MSLIGQNTLRTKHLNRALVLQTLLRLNMPSRQEIASYTKLTPATITNIINELIQEGLVMEIGSMATEQRKAGRKTILLDLVEEARMVLAVHIRSDKVELAIVTLKGKVVYDTSFNMPANADQEQFLDFLIEKIEGFISEHKNTKIACIGIGSVGLVDFDNGLIIEAEHMGWRQFELTKIISEHFKVPAYIDHHVRGMALAEKMFGSCKRHSDFLCVFIGQGIGSGMYLKDQLYRSEGTGAGEIGHMTYQPEGRLCWCGNRGCLERYASEGAILAELDFTSIDQIITEYRNGSSPVIKEIEAATKKISVVLTSFINMFHVQKVIIGGKLTQNDMPLVRQIEYEVNHQSFLAKRRKVEIHPSNMEEHIGVIGAASIALLYGVYSAKAE